MTNMNAYDFVKKSIQSCAHRQQLRTAKTMIGLYERKFPEKEAEKELLEREVEHKKRRLEAAAIKHELKMLDFIFDLREYYYDWFGIVAGFWCNASSLLRKQITMERLQKFIDEKNLPLEIGDEYPNTRSIILTITAGN